MSRAYKKRTGGAPSPSFGLPFTGQLTSVLAGDDAFYQKGYTLTRPIVKTAIGNTRFIDNGDGTLTDSATGLMYVINLFDVIVVDLWAPCVIAMEALLYAGYDDWRLPNIKEIHAIFDFEYDAPAIDPIFVNYNAWEFWSSTNVQLFPAWAYTGDLRNAVTYRRVKTETHIAFPVRGGLP